MAVKKDSKAKPKAEKAQRDIRKSRRIAEASVIISIFAATALAIVVNVLIHYLAREKKVRWPMESLGRYGLSDSSKRILEHLDKPVRLTSIYTAAAEERHEEYATRVADLLGEMQQWNSDLTIVNATTDSQKAAVHARLRDRLNQVAGEHIKVIADFQKLINQQIPLYEQMADQWRSYPKTGWLVQFGLPKNIEMGATGLKEALRDVSSKYRQEVEGSSLPDYPKLARELRDSLANIEGGLKEIGTKLTDLSRLPDKAKEIRTQSLADAQTCTDKLAEIIKLLGAVEDPAPGKPAKVLDDVAAAATAAATAGGAVLAELNRLSAASSYTRYANAWQTPSGSLPQDFAALAGAADRLAEQAKSISTTFTAEKQLEAVLYLRKVVPTYELGARADRAKGMLVGLLDELTELDETTAAIFAEAAKEDYLGHLIKPVAELLTRADDLEDLSDQDELITRTKHDNIVIVEVGDKTEVVGFDDVWPLAPRQLSLAVGNDEEEPKRNFNGDMAISSRILSLSAEPFAEVVLTFWEQIPEGRMRQFQRPVVGPIPTPLLQTTRERLEKANLKVTEWNLAVSTNPPEKTDELPRVLLILPPPTAAPPSPMGGPPPPPPWTTAHEKAVTGMIESGTPAIFLVGYTFPGYYQIETPPYALGDYLQKDWGINVSNGCRVIQTARDPDRPGKFKLPLKSWQYMAVSDFTEHPAGKPLQARRFYWVDACPILRPDKDESGAKVEDILVVNSDHEEIWATSEVRALIEKVRNRLPLSPKTDGDGAKDILPEFALTVQATKQIDGKDARVIVISTGMSFLDDYLSEPVVLLLADGTISTEPAPAANVDLLVNSIYHLTGRSEFIGAGPTFVRPIQIASEAATRVKIIFGLLWPLGVLLTGALVMLVRKR